MSILIHWEEASSFCSNHFLGIRKKMYAVTVLSNILSLDVTLCQAIDAFERQALTSSSHNDTEQST